MTTYTLFLQLEDDSGENSGDTPLRCAVVCEQGSRKHAFDDYRDAKDALEQAGFDLILIDN